VKIIALLVVAACGSPIEACRAAGGECTFQPSCTTQIIRTVDCNPNRNPGGAVCCTR
jgi:hypothetical protein